MTTCAGCACPLDEDAGDIVIRIKYGGGWEPCCSASCVENFLESKSEAQKAASEITPSNWFRFF